MARLELEDDKELSFEAKRSKQPSNFFHTDTSFEAKRSKQPSIFFHTDTEIAQVRF
jgi:hypothetical protein